MAETLSEQLADYRANWRTRVPADRQALMDQHVAHLAATGIDRTARQVGDRAPPISLLDQHGKMLLSDVGQATGRAFGVVYAFTDEVRQVYDGFKLDIPAKNGAAPDDWSLPLSATYVIGADGAILFADTRVDYRERTDPLDVLRVLEHRAAAE